MSRWEYVGGGYFRDRLVPVGQPSPIMHAPELLKKYNALLERIEGSCTWKECIDGIWETSCDGAWLFTEGGPQDNEVQFCFRCGRSIKEERHQEANDE